LCFVNTLSKQVDVIHLPSYGSLLSITAYDGYVYALFGLDEDIPSVARIATINLETRVILTHARWKLADNKSLFVGTPFVFMPTLQAFLFEVIPTAAASKVLMITVSNSTSNKLSETPLQSGWSALWMDVARENLTVAGVRNGLLALIEPLSGKVTPIRKFSCIGFFTVDFKQHQVFDLSSCAQLSIETVNWQNQTVSNLEVDPGLSTAVGIHTANAYSPYGCGAKCGVHPDCEKFTTCKTCRAGRCSDEGDCGSWCQSNGDCFAGVCAGNCDNGRCGKKGCATQCVNHDDCKGRSKTCTVCRLGRCSDGGECGNYCLSPTDCYGGSCQGKCQNWKCSP